MMCECKLCQPPSEGRTGCDHDGWLNCSRCNTSWTMEHEIAIRKPPVPEPCKYYVPSSSDRFCMNCHRAEDQHYKPSPAVDEEYVIGFWAHGEYHEVSIDLDCLAKALARKGETR